MAKKAARSKVVDKVEKIDEDLGVYQLKGELFWRYKAADSDYQRVQAQILQINSEIKAYIDSQPTLKDLFERKAGLVGASAQALSELTSVNEAIEKMYKISLKNCAIDDKTGIIHILESNGTTAPLKKGRKKKTREG